MDALTEEHARHVAEFQDAQAGFKRESGLMQQSPDLQVAVAGYFEEEQDHEEQLQEARRAAEHHRARAAAAKQRYQDSLMGLEALSEQAHRGRRGASPGEPPREGLPAWQCPAGTPRGDVASLGRAGAAGHSAEAAPAPRGTRRRKSCGPSLARHSRDGSRVGSKRACTGEGPGTPSRASTWPHPHAAASCGSSSLPLACFAPAPAAAAAGGAAACAALGGCLRRGGLPEEGPARARRCSFDEEDAEAPPERCRRSRRLQTAVSYGAKP
ncbi:unnamed protein product [Prorocentrum cordatum]|uniref:Uncharacterized protein n=1 Tax=Prorocentrum cordatum TaxID=2364126 RepID=A0ABN9TF09_9DINO|nr:unnamed protein product [Polarella glacialis]